jgi:KDO2-lipid IV(A) lauroyltransferase
VIARRVNNEGVNRSLLQLRSQLGVNTILRETGFGSQRQILGALARNEILGILMDQDTKVDGVFVDFFGRPAYTPKGPVALALATGAVLLPVFILRQPDDTHKISFLPIYQLQLSGDKEADMLRNTAQLTRIIEEQIRQTPQQWVWMHQRWRRQPPSSDGGDKEAQA